MFATRQWDIYKKISKILLLKDNKDFFDFRSASPFYHNEGIFLSSFLFIFKSFRKSCTSKTYCKSQTLDY
jgi:hypothetical protein